MVQAFSRPLPPSLPLILKGVALILLVSTLLDYGLLLSSANLAEIQARYALVTQMVDRGILPLIAMGLLLLGVWLEQQAAEGVQAGRASGSVVALVGLVFAGILGLSFVGLIPVYFNDAGEVSAKATKTLNDQTKQEEQRLEERLSQERAQITSLLNNPSQLEQLKQQLASDQIPAEAKQRLQAIQQQLDTFKANPKALDTQQDTVRKRLLSEVRGRQQQERQRLNREFRKARIRIVVNGILLIGTFLWIFWGGFQSLFKRAV